MYIENIVIGKPIVGLCHLLGESEDDKSYEDITVFETERFLPKLLSKYGFMKSISEVRRNKPELVRILDKLDFLEIRIGKRKICIVIGVDTDKELDEIIRRTNTDKMD